MERFEEATKVGNFVRIRFTDTSSADAGFGLALRSDSVVFTADPKVFLVPETTILKLKEKGINFERLL